MYPLRGTGVLVLLTNWENGGLEDQKFGKCSDKRGSASPGISHSVLSDGRAPLVRAETVEKHFVLSPAVSSLPLAVSSLTLPCMKLN